MSRPYALQFSSSKNDGADPGASTICLVLMLCSSPLQKMMVLTQVRHPVWPVGSNIAQISLFCVPFCLPKHELLLVVVVHVIIPKTHITRVVDPFYLIVPRYLLNIGVIKSSLWNINRV